MDPLLDYFLGSEPIGHSVNADFFAGIMFLLLKGSLLGCAGLNGQETASN